MGREHGGYLGRYRIREKAASPHIGYSIEPSHNKFVDTYEKKSIAKAIPNKQLPNIDQLRNDLAVQCGISYKKQWLIKTKFTSEKT